MATVETWTGTISEIGPMYPMVGTEMVLVVVGVVAWLVWHMVQAKRENQAYEEEIKRFGDAESLRKMIDEEDPRQP